MHSPMDVHEIVATAEECAGIFERDVKDSDRVSDNQLRRLLTVMFAVN